MGAQNGSLSLLDREVSGLTVSTPCDVTRNMVTYHMQTPAPPTVLWLTRGSGRVEPSILPVFYPSVRLII